MKMIYGLVAVEGRLRVLGLDAKRQRREIKSRIGVVLRDEPRRRPDHPRQPDLQGRYFGIDSQRARERADELLEFALLVDRAGSRSGLSGG
jgi:lipooligosaccharide transport system ATP-binding protein